VHPNLLHFGHLLLPTYGLLAAAGLIAAMSLSLRTSVATGLSPDTLWNAALVTIASAFILSRLLLIVFNLRSFFTYPILLLTLPSLTPVGVFLTAMAAILYLRLKHIPLRPALDAWAPCATLLWAFLALGHFAEGSDPGLPTATPLSLPIPPDPTRLHPVSLYAAICALALTIILLRTLPGQLAPKLASSPASTSPASASREADPAPPHTAARNTAPLPRPFGTTAALGLALTGVTQFLLSFLRQPAPSASPPFGKLLDPIQWVALAMIATGTLLYLTREVSPQRPLPHAL
jgi:phosphatidylglycerol:prolipoprotein diacylglycerol transferase